MQKKHFTREPTREQLKATVAATPPEDLCRRHSFGDASLNHCRSFAVAMDPNGDRGD